MCGEEISYKAKGYSSNGETVSKILLKKCKYGFLHLCFPSSVPKHDIIYLISLLYI